MTARRSFPSPVHRGPTAAAVAVFAVALLGAAMLGGAGCSSDAEVSVELRNDGDVVQHEFVVPEGTEAKIDAGEVVEIVPQVLDVTVGDMIRIRNEDVSTAQVGIFNVAAGETVTMEFTSPGELVGACDVHPSGEFRIRVSEA
jgi:plastocyanin